MLYEIIGKRFGKRFIHHLNPGATVPVSLAPPSVSLEPAACLSLLEAPATADNSLETQQLLQSLESLAHRYHEQSKQLLSTEQVALAVVLLTIQKSAEALRSKQQIDSQATLSVKDHSSCMAIILLAEALGIERIRLSRQHKAYPASAQCLHALNRPLSQLTIQDLETDGRALRERCERQFSEQDQENDNLQSNWRLHLRYADDDKVLKLKCMPLDMLLEQFEKEYRSQFGAPPDNNDVVVDAQELSVSRKFKCPEGEAHALMSPLKLRWQQVNSSKEQGWDANPRHPRLFELHAGLTDPQLNKLLQPHLRTESFLDSDDFFLEN